MFLCAFPLVRNHAGYGRRDTGLSRHSACLFANVNRLFLPPLHFRRKVILTLLRREACSIVTVRGNRFDDRYEKQPCEALKIEQKLKFNLAIRGGRGKRTAGQCDRLETHGRGCAQIANRIVQVHVIEDISRVDAKREVVAVYDELMKSPTKEEYYHTRIGERFPCSRISLTLHLA